MTVTRAISLISLLFILGFGQVVFGEYGETQPDGTYSIQGLWHFTGNATDSSGNGNNGNVTGATLTQFGTFGQAYQVSSSDSINFGSDSSLDDIPPDGITLIWWFNLSDFSSLDTYFSKDNGSGYFRIRCSSNVTQNVRFESKYWSSGFDIAQWVILSEDVWVQLALSWDGNSNSSGTAIRLYRDGVLQSPSSYSGHSGDTQNQTDAPSDFLIGGFDGIMDEILVYDRVLSADEIRRKFAMQSGKYGIN